LGIEVVPFQKSWALIREEYISIPEKLIEPCAILVRVVEDGGTHSHLDVPRPGFDLRIAGSPDVEHVRAVECHVSSHRGSRDDMTHPECANASERKIAARLERNGVTLPNFLHRDQRHFGKDLCILGFATKFLVRTDHR